MLIPISQDINKLFVRIDGEQYPVNKMLLNTQEVTGVEVYADYYSQYFTIESLEDGNVITLTKGSNAPNVTFYYSTDGSTWTSTNDTISWNLDQNDKIMLKATANRLNGGSNKIEASWHINGTMLHDAYGNIMSLLYGDDFKDTTLQYAYSFAYLFGYNGYLANAKNLKLPNNTSRYCYTHMFDACTALTTAPTLPSITLANCCYLNMFWNCFSLITAPELPATTLADSCYSGMFKDCRALAYAPNLPATTLAYRCYYEMFSGCTSLVNAPVLPAITLVNCCYQNMFNGCTSLVKAPQLPATTLTGYCYNGMFNGCTSLNEVICLATDISAEGCLIWHVSSYVTIGWLENVASSGTFYKDSTMNSFKVGTNVPTGWTINDFN